MVVIEKNIVAAHGLMQRFTDLTKALAEADNATLLEFNALLGKELEYPSTRDRRWTHQPGDALQKLVVTELRSEGWDPHDSKL